MFKENLLAFMTMRYLALKDRTERDFGGLLTGEHAKMMEVKYWKEAIERGEFDEKDGMAHNNVQK